MIISIKNNIKHNKNITINNNFYNIFSKKKFFFSL